MSIPTIDILSPADGAEVNLVFSANGDINPNDAVMSAWVVKNENGNRTDGMGTSVAGAEWAFNFTVPQAGTYTLTIQAVDNSGKDPETATRSRQIVVRVSEPGGGTG